MKIRIGIPAIAAFLLTGIAGHADAGALAPVGHIPHLAWGAGWQSVVFVYNQGATDATVLVNTYGDGGDPIALPWTDPFTSARTGVTGALTTSLNFTVKAGAIVAFLASSDEPGANNAWAQIFSDSSSVTGGVNFKYNVGLEHGEGMVTIDPGTAKSWDMVFFSEKESIRCDYAYEFTAYAFANTTTNPVTVTRTVVDRTSGVEKFHDQIELKPRGHTAFLGWDLVQQADNAGAPTGIWVMRVSAPGPGQIAPLALHFRQDKSGLTADGKSCQLGPRVFESVPTWVVQ